MLDLFDDILVKEYTVSEITKNIKKLLEEKFQYIKVRGEISNYKKATSGHIYFSLKDDKSMISVVFFKQYADYSKFALEEGMEVIVSGKVTIYAGRSNYQILAEEVKVSGEGELLKLIEKRKAKLLAEGLFDVSRKKPIPEFIEKVGLITASTGAAVHDITSRLADKTPVQIFLYSVAVQGKDSAGEIIKAIKYFNNLSGENKPDVIVITRGGGSVEDLMSFNDEELTRQVAHSKIPTISAVGHEVDFTLIDYASDLRLPTPTAVAEIIARPKAEILAEINNIFSQMTDIVISKFDSFEEVFANFNDKLRSYILSIEEQKKSLMLIDKLFLANLKIFLQTKFYFYQEKLNAVNFKEFYAFIQNLNENLSMLAQKLEFFNYKKVLAKGYTVLKQSGKFIRQAKLTAPNQEYILEFEDGERVVKIVS